jgi:hypothetical protein
MNGSQDMENIAICRGIVRKHETAVEDVSIPVTAGTSFPSYPFHKKGNMTNVQSFVRGHIQAQQNACALVHSGVIKYNTTQNNCVFSNLLPVICNEHLHFLFGLRDSFIDGHDHGPEHHPIQIFTTAASSPHQHIIDCNTKLFAENDIILPASSVFQGDTPEIDLDAQAKIPNLSVPIRLGSSKYQLSQPITKYIRVLVNATTTVRSSYKPIDVGLQRNVGHAPNDADGSHLFRSTAAAASGNGWPTDPLSCTDPKAIHAINNVIAFLKYYFPVLSVMPENKIDAGAANEEKHYMDTYTYSKLSHMFELAEEPGLKEELIPLRGAMFAEPDEEANNISGIFLIILRALLMRYTHNEGTYNRVVPNIQFIDKVGIVAIKDIFHGDTLHLEGSETPLEWESFKKLKVYMPSMRMAVMNETDGSASETCRRPIEYVAYSHHQNKKATCQVYATSEPQYPGREETIDNAVEYFNKRAGCLPQIGWNT